MRLPSYLVLTLAAWFASLLPNQLCAQESTKNQNRTTQEIARPLIAINLASVNRALDHASFLFQQIDRPELMDFLGAQIANVRDFKGVDRNKPAGLMIFLAEGIIPQPVPIAYIPIEDIGEFGQTVAQTPLKLQKSADADDRYELIPKNGPKQYVRLVHGYALITNNDLNLDRNFVDPAEFTQSLSNRYDLAVSANLKVTPEPIKQLLLTLIRTSVQAEMQQRDSEPEGAYRVRRAQAESNLHLIEGILTEGEEATLGLKVEKENRKAFIELVVRAKADSAFAKELTGQPKPSYFAAAVDHAVPLSVSVSGELNDYNKKSFGELFKVGELEANRGLAKLPQTALREEIPQLESVRGFFESLKATVDNGHFDGFVQFHGDPESKFAIIGGVRLIDGTRFGVGLTDILGRIRENTVPFAIELSAASHGEIVFHRLTPENIGNDEKQIYGDKPSIYIGTDNSAVWFAFGGDDALPTLRATIDKVEASKAHAPKTDNLVPFELVMNMSQWVKLRNADRERPGRFAEMALEAFSETGSDVLRMDARPIENGFRMRVQFENGFLRLLGMGIARQIDRQQNP